jgi:cytochrome c
MDSFELNKVAGAVLGSVLLLLVVNEIGNFLVHPTHLEKSVLAIDTGDESSAADAKEAAEAGPSLAVLLADADAGKGEKVAKKCTACHSFEAGGANKIGPALYGVIGRGVASHEGFSYSSALAGLGGDWGYKELDGFLANPKQYAPGTKMSFAGLKKPGDRADLIAYLRQQHDSAPALPTE